MQAVIYDEQTGEIRRRVTVPDASALALQCRPGEAALPGEGSDAAHMVVDGQIVAKPAERRIQGEESRQAAVEGFLLRKLLDEARERYADDVARIEAAQEKRP